MRSPLSELKQLLIMSVGTHRRSRPLSPVEVADGLATLKAEGMSVTELARMLQLEGTSMLGRFARLRSLAPAVRHLVDWRGSSSAIPFSTATEMARLRKGEQEELAHEVLQKSMTKGEVIQVVQLCERADKPVGRCVEKVLAMRPRVVYKEVFVGQIRDDSLRSALYELTQARRDSLLRCALEGVVPPSVSWKGRLGERSFTLVGGTELADELRGMRPDFEVAINKILVLEAGR